MHFIRAFAPRKLLAYRLLLVCPHILLAPCVLWLACKVYLLEILPAIDLPVVMEAIHLRAIRQIRKNALKKTYLLSAFDPSEGDDAADIADPYGGDSATFKDCYSRVVRCVDGLYELIAGNANPSEVT